MVAPGLQRKFKVGDAPGLLRTLSCEIKPWLWGRAPNSQAKSIPLQAKVTLSPGFCGVGSAICTLPVGVQTVGSGMLLALPTMFNDVAGALNATADKTAVALTRAKMVPKDMGCSLAKVTHSIGAPEGRRVADNAH